MFTDRLWYGAHSVLETLPAAIKEEMIRRAVLPKSRTLLHSARSNLSLPIVNRKRPFMRKQRQAVYFFYLRIYGSLSLLEVLHFDWRNMFTMHRWRRVFFSKDVYSPSNVNISNLPFSNHLRNIFLNWHFATCFIYKGRTKTVEWWRCENYF